jgi:hypothetical protein
VSCINSAKKAAQIRRDYALDLFAMAVVMRYLHKIDELETVNARLRTLLLAAGRVSDGATDINPGSESAND